MTILKAVKIPSSDIVQYAWSSLRRFHNVSNTTNIIMDHHGICKSQKGNATRQAEQIRSFLLQSKEYLDASKIVSLVTKPVLMYYSIMCLATAEILLKHSGDSSLSRAREGHRHHGLIFVNNLPKPSVSKLAVAANSLIAKPAIRDSKSDPGKRERYGTFDLWHRSAREAPATGDISIHSDTGSTSRYGIIGVGEDDRLELLPESGISLLSALQNIPDMTGMLPTMGVPTKLVRGEITQVINNNLNTIDMQVIIHPGEAKLIDELVSNILIHPSNFQDVDYRSLTSGGILTVKFNVRDMDRPEIRMQWPSSACTQHPMSHFWPSAQCLNEFGFIYVALFMVGNYARYYPDFWMRDVEETTDLGAAIEELTNVAERRIGILALSELSFQYHVPVN